MEHKDKQIVELESEIRYLRQLLDENGIKYDYKASKTPKQARSDIFST